MRIECSRAWIVGANSSVAVLPIRPFRWNYHQCRRRRTHEQLADGQSPVGSRLKVIPYQ